MKTEDKISRLKSICQQDAGIKFVEFDDAPSGVTPNEAWTHVIGVNSKPSIVFSLDDHDSDAQEVWWRLARANGLISEDGTCLLSVGGIGLLPWARVRLSEGVPVLSLFAFYKGSPEFVVRNEEGNRYLAVTSEEHGTWFYLVECQVGKLTTVMLPGGGSAEA